MAATYNEASDLVMANDLNLYLTTGKTIIAYATSCNLDVQSDSIDTSNKMSPSWKTVRNGGASYTISADALYSVGTEQMSFDKILEMMIAREPIKWYMGYATDAANKDYSLNVGKEYYTGMASIQSCSLTGGNNEMVSFSINLEGSGPIKNKAQAEAESGS